MKNKLTNKISHDEIRPVATEYRPSKDEIERQRRYKAENALRTIRQADEYRCDKGLMKDVKTLATEQMAALKKVAKAK